MWFIGLCSDTRHAESGSEKIFRSDCTWRPLPCHSVSLIYLMLMILSQPHKTHMIVDNKLNYINNKLNNLMSILMCRVTYAILVVSLCVLRLTEMPGETALMAVCLVLGWCNVLYFARGFEMLGPYVIVIQKVILLWYSPSSFPFVNIFICL